MPETDLYMPVKSLLESMGAVVKGEVGDIDIFGLMPDGKTVAVEMKLHLNLDVIIQAVLRQKVADSVYIAVPSPKKSMLRRWHNIGTVLRRLEIGLITVKNTGAKVTFPPGGYDREAAKKRSAKKKVAIEREFSLRHGDENTGGTKGKKITVYREKCILIAETVKKYGKVAAADIALKTKNPDAETAVKRNPYGWFLRKDGYVYLTDKGKEELLQYEEKSPELICELMKEAEEV